MKSSRSPHVASVLAAVISVALINQSALPQDAGTSTKWEKASLIPHLTVNVILKGDDLDGALATELRESAETVLKGVGFTVASLEDPQAGVFELRIRFAVARLGREWMIWPTVRISEPAFPARRLALCENTLFMADTHEKVFGSTGSEQIDGRKMYQACLVRIATIFPFFAVSWEAQDIQPELVSEASLVAGKLRELVSVAVNEALVSFLLDNAARD